MFVKKSTEPERRSTVTNAQKNYILKTELENEQDDEVEDDEEEETYSARTRKSSILDKVNIFNRNPDSSKLIKKDEVEILKSQQNYIKVIDEQTKKIKWVDNKDSDEGSSTQILIRSDTNKPITTIDGTEINNQQGQGEENQHEICEVNKTYIKKNSILEKNQNKILTIPVVEKKIEADPETDKGSEKNTSQEINKNNFELKKKPEINISQMKEEDKNNISYDYDKEKTETNENIVTGTEEDEVSESDSKDQEEDLTIRIRKITDEENSNLNFYNQALKSPPKKEEIISHSDTHSIEKSEKEKLDEFFTAINHIRTSDDVNQFDFENNEKIEEIQIEDTASKEKEINFKIKSVDVQINSNKNSPKKEFSNQMIVDLVEEKIAPDNFRKKTAFAEKHKYNDLIDSTVSNPDSVINISNLSVTNNNYNSIFNTGRTLQNNSENILYSENKRKVNETDQTFNNNYPDEEIKEVAIELTKMQDGSKKLLDFIVKYKYILIIILFIIVIVSLILLKFN